MGLFFIKPPKHYVFDYKPLYYDPKKEDRERRFRSIDAENGEINNDKGENYRPNIKFRRMYASHRRSGQYSVVRLVIIFGLMLIISYLIVFSTAFEKIFELLTK